MVTPNNNTQQQKYFSPQENQFKTGQLPKNMQAPSKKFICPQLRWYTKCCFASKFNIPCPYAHSITEW